MEWSVWRWWIKEKDNTKLLYVADVAHTSWAMVQSNKGWRQHVVQVQRNSKPAVWESHACPDNRIKVEHNGGKYISRCCLQADHAPWVWTERLVWFAVALSFDCSGLHQKKELKTDHICCTQPPWSLEMTWGSSLAHHHFPSLKNNLSLDCKV